MFEGHGAVVAVDAAAAAVLCWIAVEDIARFRIRNALVVALAALYGLRALAGGGDHELLWHVAFATGMLAVMFAVYALDGAGAGDAKLMTVGCLWIGPDRSLALALFLSIATLSTYGLVKLHWLPVRRDGARIKVPFGPSIAVSLIATALIFPLG